MTLAQYVGNLRNICKDGSSPDEALLSRLYGRVSKFEWAVEERQYATPVREGWLFKASSKKVGGTARRLFAVLSTRALYFFREPADTEPTAYIRMEGLAVRFLSSHKPVRSCFELFPASSISEPGRVADGVEGRMIKFVDTADGGKQKSMSKHTSFTFTADSECDARGWVAAVHDYTKDDGSVAAGEPPQVEVPPQSRRPSLATHTDTAPDAIRRAAALAKLAEGERKHAMPAGELGVPTAGLAGSPGEAVATASSMYATRERRSGVASRSRFTVADSLRMLERKSVCSETVPAATSPLAS